MPWHGRARWVLVGALLVLLVARLALAQRSDPSLQRVQQAGVLVVALDASYPPFETTDGNGNFSGFDVAVAEEIARRLGLSVRFANIAFDSLYDALTGRRADVVISCLRYEAERTRDVIYTPSYFDAGQMLIVRAGEAIAGAADLAGRTVGVEWATEGEIEAQKLARKTPGLRVQSFAAMAEAIAALRAGVVAAVATDHVSARELCSGQTDLRLLLPPFAPDPLVIAGHSADRRLMAEVSRIVRAMQGDGTLDLLAERHLVQ